MSTAQPDASRPFMIRCPHCRAPLAVRPDWIGRQVTCRECRQPLRVPSPTSEPPKLVPVPLRTHIGPGVRMGFECPRCRSRLEANSDTAGQVARCPSCGARFQVPEYDGRIGQAGKVRLLDDNDQDPTPLHAYAACGHLAPHIRPGPDGQPRIECPQCQALSDISANNCTRCGTPFTMDGVTNPTQHAGQNFAIASLVLGLLSLPLLAILLPAVLAVVLGVVSWFQRGTPAPSAGALVGMISGAVSLSLGVLHYLV